MRVLQVSLRKPLWIEYRLGSLRCGVRWMRLHPLHLVLPITVEPTKQRLCHDERYLNLWIKGLPFSLDHLSDLPRYVLPGHFQTCFDDNSGYQHVLLHLSSGTYFDLEFHGIYFVFRTLPFGWKASGLFITNLD